MSVVRIPHPEEDTFPWLRVALVAAVGLGLGLGISYWGMERDRAAEAESSGALGARPETDASPEPEAATEPTPQPVVEPQPTTSTALEAEPPLAVEPARTASAPEPAPQPAPEPEPAPALVATPAPLPTPTPAASGPVTLRTGRVAYLRCDGVPQRPGPFPCPRDEPLEQAVWAALRAVERCDRSPGPGAADIVVDFDAEQPTIRARDTFPSDTVRTDATALLACAGDSLGNVRSSLSPRRLVVSFRLTLEAPAR